MAEQPTYSFTDDNGEAPRTSIEDHQRTFDSFIGMAKWAIGVVVLLLIGMAVFLV